MTRVLLDVDGVLADFAGRFLDLVNAHWGTNHRPEDVTTYDIAAALGWARKQAEVAYGLISEDQDFAADLAVFPGALDGVRALGAVAEIYAVTSPWHSHPRWAHDRTNWLWRHFEIPASRVVHTAAKHICVGDFLVDDKTETLERWQAEHPAGVAVQWITPHNRRDGWNGIALKDWGELVALVSGGSL